MVTFRAKPYKVGGSYAVTIPRDYISNGLVKVDKELNFEIKDANETIN